MFSVILIRKNKKKKHNSFSAYAHVACGVPQGSILGPLLFNRNICDMFFQKYKYDIASYADDNTPHTYDSDLYTVLSKLKKPYRQSVHMVEKESYETKW